MTPDLAHTSCSNPLRGRCLLWISGQCRFWQALHDSKISIDECRDQHCRSAPICTWAMRVVRNTPISLACPTYFRTYYWNARHDPRYSKHSKFSDLTWPLSTIYNNLPTPSAFWSLSEGQISVRLTLTLRLPPHLYRSGRGFDSSHWPRKAMFDTSWQKWKLSTWQVVVLIGGRRAATLNLTSCLHCRADGAHVIRILGSPSHSCVDVFLVEGWAQTCYELTCKLSSSFLTNLNSSFASTYLV